MSDKYPGIRAVRVNGVVMTPDAALAEMAQSNDAKLNEIRPEAPIANSVRIVVPDHDRLRPLILQLLKTPSPGPVEYLAESTRLSMHNLAEVVVRSGLFRSATVVEQNDTVQPEMDGADYLIWFQVRSLGVNNTGPWYGHWEIKRAGNPRMEPLGLDLGTPVGTARLESFVTSVRVAAGALEHGGIFPAVHGQPQLRGVGSGIVVDAEGHVLTNSHVAGTCNELRVVDSNGASGEATVQARDAANDLALLDTHRRWRGWAGFRDSGTLQPGEPLVVTGFPLTGLVSPDMAVTTGSVTTVTGRGGDTRQFEFSAPVEPGNSGGPVLDYTGHVIGLTVSTLNSLAVAIATGGTVPQNVNFAIKSTSAREFLEANHVALTNSGSSRTLDATGVAELARGFTVRVECR